MIAVFYEQQLESVLDKQRKSKQGVKIAPKNTMLPTSSAALASRRKPQSVSDGGKDKIIDANKAFTQNFRPPKKKVSFGLTSASVRPSIYRNTSRELPGIPRT